MKKISELRKCLEQIYVKNETEILNDQALEIDFEDFIVNGIRPIRRLKNSELVDRILDYEEQYCPKCDNAIDIKKLKKPICNKCFSNLIKKENV